MIDLSKKVILRKRINLRKMPKLRTTNINLIKQDSKQDNFDPEIMSLYWKGIEEYCNC
jgi:hypothetical protein